MNIDFSFQVFVQNMRYYIYRKEQRKIKLDGKFKKIK